MGNQPSQEMNNMRMPSASQVPSQIPSQLPSHIPSHIPSHVSSQLPIQVPSEVPSGIGFNASMVPSRQPKETTSQPESTKSETKSEPEPEIKDYAAFLRKQGIQSYIKQGKPHYKDGILVAAGGPSVQYLPPNNCLFDISKVKRISKKPKPGKTVYSRAAAISSADGVPKKFDWRKESKNISPAINQYLCGCCWAVSIATCIADKFVAYNLIDFHPKISWSYLISCFVNELNLQCKGSNPNLALEWVKVNGVGTESIDGSGYSWCSDSSKCNPAKSGEKKPSHNVDLQKIVPKCTFAKTKAIRFYIKKIRAMTLTQEEATESSVKENISFVKKHIMDYGPVVGGFSVYDNFKTGEYTCNGKNPSNIYLENVDYVTGKYKLLTTLTMGTHAVVLIGWGVGMVEESLLKLNGSDKKIPVGYWIVRNSWGKDWGMDGYFNIAQYPTNKKSQFDVSVVFTTSVKDPATNKYNYKKIVASGIVTFQPSYFGYEKPNKTVIKEKFQIINPIKNPTKDEAHIYFFISFLILLTLILFILILLSSTKK